MWSGRILEAFMEEVIMVLLQGSELVSPGRQQRVKRKNYNTNGPELQESKAHGRNYCISVMAGAENIC